MHRWLVSVVAVLGFLVLLGSWLLRDAEQWWSSTLGNVAVAILLLIPGDLALRWVASGFKRVELATENARVTAESAKSAAERTEQSPDDVRKVLLDRQVADHENELNVFRDMIGHPSRASLETALRKATDEGVITGAGVRSPVWETDLHYRYVLSDGGPGLEVRLETDDGSVLSTHPWDQAMRPEHFYQGLVEAVREAGRDLGVLLNDPTQSVQALSDMLVEVSSLRAQELMGYREKLSRIIERVDGWYFTEKYVIPADDLSYGIAVDRLHEMDWEEHLRNKGWYGAELALDFARRISTGRMSSRADLYEREPQRVA